MRFKYKQWAVDYLVDHPDIALETISLDDPFFKNPHMRVELGSGKGDFIIEMAKRNPDVNFLAVEIVRSVAGMIAKRVNDEHIPNVKVFPHDAEMLFGSIPNKYFEVMYLNFSDPWPKKRHEKRRLTHRRFLEKYSHVIKDDGKLIFKTDNLDLFKWSLNEIYETDFFNLLSCSFDYEFDSENDAMTEYETKFREKGTNINRLVLEVRHMEQLEIKLKEEGKISRLTNRTFKFDPRLGEGFFAANYFLKSNKIVKENCPGHIVTMQFFQRRDDSMVCGLDEVIALIHTFAKNPEKLEILALNDGDIVNAMEPVLKIKGQYEDFGFLESMIDGILARRSSVATNVYELKKALNGADAFSMADRQDEYHTQIGDGYATYVAGIKKVSTDAQGYWWGGKGMGTMPHALIQVSGGDIVKAAEMYHKTFPSEKVTALIDYNNDVVTDSLKLARHLKEDLRAVRVDTSKSLIDHYFDDKDTSTFDPHGVCKELIFALRKALDDEGFNYVKIVVSSGFTAAKIKEWVKLGVPVDTYGVGTSLVNNMTVGFTGDLVVLDGKKEAKEGREDIPSDRLKKVPYPIY